MHVRTVAAFLIGVGLTAAGFLLFDGDGGERAFSPDSGLGSDAPRDSELSTRPILRGVEPTPLDAMTPSAEEVEWIKGALKSERLRRDAARIREGDTGVQVMQRVFEFGADPAPLLQSFKAFRAPIIESTEAPYAISEPSDGETISFKDGDVDQVIIELGPGSFSIAKNDQFWRPVYTEDKTVTHVVIRGAGVDQTTLVAGHQWALLLVAGTVKHLVIRDLTLDGGEAKEGMLLDIRGQAAVALENVRVTGWQRAGHSAAIGVSGNAYLGCKGCEFVGNGERSGWAISLRGRSLVLCEDCRFRHLDGALVGSSEKTTGSVAVFRDCVFEASALSDRAFKFPVRVFGGRAMYGSADISEDDRRARWGANHAERVDGLVFESASPACTLGAILHVLDKIEVPTGEQVVAIELDGIEDGEPSQFRIHTLPATGRRTKSYVTNAAQGWSTLRHLPRAGGQSLPPVDVVRRAKSIVEVLRGTAVPLDSGVSKIKMSWQDGEPPIPTISIRDSQRRRWYFNAENGELLRGPK